MYNVYANGTAALKMPSSYVLMDAEEMIYVGGGYTFLCNESSSGGTFYGVNLSVSQCNSAANSLTTIGGVLTVSSLLCSGLALIPGLQAAVAGAGFYGALATVCSLSSWFFTEAANRGGAYVGYSSSKNKLLFGYGSYSG